MPSVVSPVIRDDGGGEEDGMLKSQIEKEKDFELGESIKDTDVEVERDTLEEQTGSAHALSEDNFVQVINVDGNHANRSEETGGLISSCGPEHPLGFSDEVEPNDNRSSDYVNLLEMEPKEIIPDLNDLFQVGPDLNESSRDGSVLKDSFQSGSPCLRHSSKASGKRRNSRMSFKFKDLLKDSAMASKKSLGGFRRKVPSVGEWSEVNFINLNRILRCFYLASGLKVNLAKSRVFGIGVEEIEITRLAGILHCEPASFPFVYLGLPIGANMKLAKNWKPIVDKFNSKLSSWKAKNLSFGGRLTLLKSVLGSLPLYYFSIFKAPVKVIGSLESIRRRFLWSGSDDKRKINWVAWNVVTAPKSCGGLGVGSLNSLNIALLSKWWWRFKSEKFSFWGSCIKAIHGLKGFDGGPLAKRAKSTVERDRDMSFAFDVIG
ncbi:hypothetical protein L2E82_24535 [Cichorium intybus]|uniref:Uncharacterized protein n=1 Tax=Cichorium intybus TaxID=13427 RepID=A0ACB9E220_CICIN|nr:hypothetical protein L2E82_24535 [Cichorium intybus]